MIACSWQYALLAALVNFVESYIFFFFAVSTPPSPPQAFVGLGSGRRVVAMADARYAFALHHAQ
jgi:hypothetical protein